MLRNLAASLFLTERVTDELDENKPKVVGRVITTLQKAKEVRPIVEKCVTIARRTLADQAQADQVRTTAQRGSDEWKAWRKGEGWKKWVQASAPVVAARRRVLRLLGDREAMHIVFEKIAPRFADRPGGYTRILQLAKPRLGDAGTRAILEFVGIRDRVAQAAVAPKFEDRAEGPAAE
jgi:large subunit ribosomal protein L17